ncbi:hypothetical protein [Haloarchaeobius iranensis]|nr:hypothetical protein [Haloarchaeobius iranensis]
MQVYVGDPARLDATGGSTRPGSDPPPLAELAELLAADCTVVATPE